MPKLCATNRDIVEKVAHANSLLTQSLLSFYNTLTSDVVAVKGGHFVTLSASADIFQRDLLCSGNESNLLECMQYTSGTRDCPANHSEDAAVKCNGLFSV